MSELTVTVVLAPDGPATPDRVASWLKMFEPDGVTPKPDQDVVDTVAATNAVVRRWRPVPVSGQPWPVDDVQGTVMLAGRLYRRRNTPSGVEAFGPDGVAYVSRNDPDVAMLLRVGPYADPVCG